MNKKYLIVTMGLLLMTGCSNQSSSSKEEAKNIKIYDWMIEADYTIDEMDKKLNAVHDSYNEAKNGVTSIWNDYELIPEISGTLYYYKIERATDNIILWSWVPYHVSDHDKIHDAIGSVYKESEAHKKQHNNTGLSQCSFVFKKNETRSNETMDAYYVILVNKETSEVQFGNGIINFQKPTVDPQS